VGNNFFFYPVGGNSGPELMYNGAAVTAGQFGGFNPIGAEKTASGYDVAWKMAGADQYTAWNIDSNGNFSSSIIGVVSGHSSTLESLEPTFQQDLNEDSIIGVPGATPTVIESFGATSLVEVGNNFFFYPVGGNSGPELKINGAAVTAGQFGGYNPIGAEKTASGYDVAWKLAGADQYTAWNTDNNGNFISSIIGVASGSSSALQSLEPTFQQDLNKDGTIGPATIGTGQTVEVTGPYSGSITFASTTGTLLLDHSSSFTGTVAGLLGPNDLLDLLDINPATVQPPTESGTTAQGTTLQVTDGTHTANIALLGNYMASTFVAASDGHGGTVVHDPPSGTAAAGHPSTRLAIRAQYPGLRRRNPGRPVPHFAMLMRATAASVGAGFKPAPTNLANEPARR
jgi:Tryptophan-rich Synechocystis species C-terminal domain